MLHKIRRAWIIVCHENIHRLLSTLVSIAMLAAIGYAVMKITIVSNVMERQAIMEARQNKLETRVNQWGLYIRNTLDRK
jgi:heme A synthase